MRAMVFDHYGEPDVMHLKDVPVPEPQDGEVLIRVGYAGVNPSDSKSRSGQSARAGYRPRGVDFPFVTGMDAAGVVERTGKLHIAQQTLASLLTLVLLFAAWPQSLVAQAQPGPLQVPSAPPYMQLTPEELQQLVAPIALYPDSLVAQILAASTFPEQVVDADRWVQSHPDLKGEDLAQAVDQLPWDPSVKALAAFPSVIGNMDKNLSWTSSLGDDYYSQEQGVMDAIQVMRRRAQEAGHLNSTPEQTVTTEGSDIEIEPVSPEIVYVPAYDPWIVYGAPIGAWPGWYPYPGISYDGPVIFFGEGFGTGFYRGYGWGWHHWGCDWHHHYAVYDHGRYYSPSRTFYNRDRFYRGEVARGVYNRPERAPEPFGGDREAARGYPEARGQSNARSGAASVDRGTARSDAEPRGQSDVRSGAISGNSGAGRAYAEPRSQTEIRSSAFNGFGHGGEERSFSSRKRQLRQRRRFPRRRPPLSALSFELGCYSFLILILRTGELHDETNEVKL